MLAELSGSVALKLKELEGLGRVHEVEGNLEGEIQKRKEAEDELESTRWAIF